MPWMYDYKLRRQSIFYHITLRPINMVSIINNIRLAKMGGIAHGISLDNILSHLNNRIINEINFQALGRMMLTAWKSNAISQWELGVYDLPNIWLDSFTEALQ